MPSYRVDPLIRTIDARSGALRHFLNTPRAPITLSEMNRPVSRAELVLKTTQQLAARTARCYHTFNDPVMQSTLRKPNAERLQWAKTLCLREFQLCVVLQQLASQYAEKLSDEPSAPTSAATPTATASPAASSSPRRQGTIISDGSKGQCCHYLLRNTDDNSLIDGDQGDASATPGTSAPLTASPRADNASPSPAADATTTSAHSGSGTEGYRNCSRLSKEDLREGLLSGEFELTDVPFDVALALLRPEQVLLDVLVNEMTIRSDELNAWFSRFCQSRVAWRVLHEHVLHVLSPEESPPVVENDTSVPNLIRGAGEVVLDIHAKVLQSIHGASLTIGVAEEENLLSQRPEGDLISSSAHVAPVYPPVFPPTSPTVHSVEGHLSYVIRELLKNACVATAKCTLDIGVTVRYGESDRWVVVDVVDTGGGIPRSQVKDIWKFGYTTSDHYESHLGGFGVGLPTSKVYMDMWGGAIDVYTVDGVGTTMRIRYPKVATEVLTPDDVQMTR